MYSGEPIHTDEQGLGKQLEPICNNSVLIQDVVWKTFRERWTIETSGERGSGKYALTARHDDVIYIYIYIYMPYPYTCNSLCLLLCLCAFLPLNNVIVPH